MTAFDPLAFSQPRPAFLRYAPGLLAATLFLSALLLFSVQPMFTKMVLPRLGGAPSVWSVAMVFFQAMLLLGYAYAHLIARLGQARGALIHLGVLASAALALPIGTASGFLAPPPDGLYVWVFALFAASVGLPFAALAASAPLLQSWFAASGHPESRNPYVLYAASNLGSFAALIAYPLAIEPWLPLGAQTHLWTVAFGVMSLMVAVAAVLTARGASGSLRAAPVSAPRITSGERIRWTLLAAVPSGLVVGVTAYITTDVASAPLLWVLPLALYLLTFVAVFRDQPWMSHDLVVRMVPFKLVPLMLVMFIGDRMSWIAPILLHLASFFVLTLMCHGELYRDRPAPARLTEFYLWVSFGGVVGGALSGLVAPHVFNGTYEYPLLLAAAYLALPGSLPERWRAFIRSLVPWLMLAGVMAAGALLFGLQIPLAVGWMFKISLVVLAGLMLWQRRRPAAFLGVMLLAFVLSEFWRPGQTRIESARSFFGVHQIAETADGQLRLLTHGTTIHGAERVRNPDGTPVTGRPEPSGYYYLGGPISQAIDAKRTAGGLHDVAIVGLGAGTLACQSREGERWSFFEIDPEVVRIARDPRRFRFLSACGPSFPVVVGDARLTLAASGGHYDVIVLDAFSSDAIPVHLLTREAFAGYLPRLAPGGIIIAHISNRHMELAPVLGAVGRTHGLVAYARLDDQAPNFFKDFRSNAYVAALARADADLGALTQMRGWRRIDPDQRIPAWTDDYSDILRAILRKRGLL